MVKVIAGLLQYAQTFIAERDVSKEAHIQQLIERLQLSKNNSEPVSSELFLEQKLPNVNFSCIPMEGSFMPVMKERWEEIKRCQKSGAYLSTVILTGSILEGILLGIA